MANPTVKTLVRVAYNSDDDSGPVGWFRVLTFGKHNRTWRLMIETGWEGGGDTTSELLTDASRELRLRAVEYIPALVARLVDAASDDLAEVEEKTEELKAFIQTVSTQTFFNAVSAKKGAS